MLIILLLISFGSLIDACKHVRFISESTGQVDFLLLPGMQTDTAITSLYIFHFCVAVHMDDEQMVGSGRPSYESEDGHLFLYHTFKKNRGRWVISKKHFDNKVNLLMLISLLLAYLASV